MKPQILPSDLLLGVIACMEFTLERVNDIYRFLRKLEGQEDAEWL